MKWYFKVLKNYATFSGRARRKEYWMFFLFHILISIAFGFLEGSSGNSLPGNVYMFAILIPSLAVGVRRMHDIGKSGWYILIPIYSLVLAATEGERGDNAYGADPKTEISNDPDILHS